jgi:predicted Zn-dependent protease
MAGAVVIGLWVLRTQKVEIASLYPTPETATMPVSGGACDQVLQYRLGALDPRFHLSREQAETALRESVALWNTAAGRSLIVSAESAATSPDQVVTVNFVYDDRQATTDTLQTMLGSLHSDQEKYDATKKRLDALDKTLTSRRQVYTRASAQYDKDKQRLDRSAQQYDTEYQAYEKQVTAWREHPGTAEEFDTIEKRRRDLEETARSIQKKQRALKDQYKALEEQRQSLNDLVGQANTLVSIVNTLATKANAQAQTYNTEGQSRGAFETGVYQTDGQQRVINIYQFLDDRELHLIVAHEFGHALGFDHIDDPQAVMYSQVGGQALVLAPADKVLVDGMCKK